MQTIGWIFVLVAALLVRGVSRGRSMTQLPGDLSDLVNGIIGSDMTAVKEVLRRTGDTTTAVEATNAVGVAGVQSNTITNDMPTSGNTKADLIRFGNSLKDMGYKVSEHPSFGGVCTNNCHVVNSQHYRGEAIDVNADSGFRGGEGVALDNANNMAKAAGFKTLWKVAGHFNHLHVAVNTGAKLAPSTAGLAADSNQRQR